MIVHEGLRRMVGEQEDVFYYLTVMNENYRHPALPEGAEEGILRGMHRVREIDGAQVRLLGSGTILREVEAACDLLRQDFEIPAEVWSVTSFTELRRDGLERDREARLRRRTPSAEPWVTQCLGGSEAPVVAATDYMKALPDGIRAWVPGRYEVLGHRRLRPQRLPAPPAELLRGRPPSRRRRRAAGAGRRGRRSRPSKVAEAIERYEIDVDAPDPAVS